MSAAAADSVIACAAVPVTMIADVLGLPGLTQTQERIEGKATLCQYEVPKGEQYVSIRFERGYAPERFEASKTAFPNATDVAGLGEQAFVSNLPLQTAGSPHGIQSVAVLKHRTHLTISAPVASDKIQFLAREILEGI